MEGGEHLKSRYKKNLVRIMKNSPIVAFSKETPFDKGQILSKEDLQQFNKMEKLNEEFISTTNYIRFKEEMYSNFISFVDNYLNSGNHKTVYLLIPRSNGTYQVMEKESISEWADAYWKREDPENKRDWAYFDEDTVDLFDYIHKQFRKHTKFSI